MAELILVTLKLLNIHYLYLFVNNYRMCVYSKDSLYFVYIKKH